LVITRPRDKTKKINIVISNSGRKTGSPEFMEEYKNVLVGGSFNLDNFNVRL
jgi:hypothetical protein